MHTRHGRGLNAAEDAHYIGFPARIGTCVVRHQQVFDGHTLSIGVLEAQCYADRNLLELRSGTLIDEADHLVPIVAFALKHDEFRVLLVLQEKLFHEVLNILNGVRLTHINHAQSQSIRFHGRDHGHRLVGTEFVHRKAKIVLENGEDRARKI